MAQPGQQFREGDRVRLIRRFAGVPIGTYGTILTKFTLQPLYDVRFDGHKAPHIIEASYLELAPPET